MVAVIAAEPYAYVFLCHPEGPAGQAARCMNVFCIAVRCGLVVYSCDWRPRVGQALCWTKEQMLHSRVKHHHFNQCSVLLL